VRHHIPPVELLAGGEVSEQLVRALRAVHVADSVEESIQLDSEYKD
jgi:hypothetical protein